MPIFSLTQFQRSGIFPRGPGFVLCLDRNWQIEMKSRFDYLSKSWSNGEVHTEVEQEQIRVEQASGAGNRKTLGLTGRNNA